MNVLNKKTAIRFRDAFRMSALLLLSCFAGTAGALPIPVATYSLDGSLAADEAGVNALVAIDPLGLNEFRMENVFGIDRLVYRFDGNSSQTNQQAGLKLDTRGILDTDDSYSVEMIFRFDVNDSSWENILGVSDRSSDNAFYVAPSGGLQVYPQSAGVTPVTQDEWHHITLTNNGDSGLVTGYLDGVFQFDLVSSSLDFSSYVADNPERWMHFFTDNLSGGGYGEFADGSVALIRLYDLELNADEVGGLPEGSVPEPSTLLLVGAGVIGLLRRHARSFPGPTIGTMGGC
jgi:hypothetical protein